MLEASYIIPLETLVKNGQPAPGAVELIKTLAEQQMKYVILSEQTSRFQDQIADYLIDRGFRYIRSDMIYTSTNAAIDYLRITNPDQKAVATIGGEGMKVTLRKEGYALRSDHVEFLLVGMNRNCSYDDYSKALQVLLEGGQLISLDNRRLHRFEGMDGIGNRAVVRMLEYASGKKSISFGHGSVNYLQMVKRYLQEEPGDIVYVGTDFQKDIVPALKIGFNTVFVTMDQTIDFEKMQSDVHPDYIVSDLFGLTR